jgi:hypothetical protein
LGCFAKERVLLGWLKMLFQAFIDTPLFDAPKPTLADVDGNDMIVVLLEKMIHAR